MVFQNWIWAGVGRFGVENPEQNLGNFWYIRGLGVQGPTCRPLDLGEEASDFNDRGLIRFSSAQLVDLTHFQEVLTPRGCQMKRA